MNQKSKPSTLGEIGFSKIVGAGNDFVFVDLRKNTTYNLFSYHRSRWVQEACDRHFGVGADGVVFVEEDAALSILKWDFYNSDGSSAEMCGNATRCMGAWAERSLGQTTVEFMTSKGKVIVSKESCGNWASRIPYDSCPIDPTIIDARHGGGQFYLVDTGVPHCVLEVDNLEKSQLNSNLVKYLRFHPQTGSKGANVTLLERVAPSRFKTVTFERGVENWTLSCGTGVLATALVGLKDVEFGEAEVLTPGGELKVRRERKGHSLVLIGPATIVYCGRLSKNFSQQGVLKAQGVERKPSKG